MIAKLQTAALFYLQDWLKLSRPLPPDCIYCICQLSRGKTSLGSDLAPTVTLVHHLCFSLHLSAVILSARPSSGLHSCTYDNSITAVTLKWLQDLGWETVHFLDLIDWMLLCWLPRTGLSWDKFWFHTCAMCKMQTSSWETPSSAADLELSTVAADLRLEIVESTLRWTATALACFR